MNKTATKKETLRFVEFRDLIKQRFSELCKTGKLFKSSLTGQQVWDLYIGSFKPEHDPVFRDPESSTHTCNLDKSFLRRYGNIVAIDKDYNIITMFDLDLHENCEYFSSAKAMREALQTAPIKDVFFETFDELNNMNYEKCNKKQAEFRLGISQNHKMYTQEEADKFGVVTAGKAYQFNHFSVDLPTEFVDKSGDSHETIAARYRDAKNVFQRGMEEIPSDTLQLVKDLIVQGSLLNGDAHLFKIEEFLPFKKEYDGIAALNRDNWCWVKSYKLPIAKFRNELMGTLCVELAEGKELNAACKTWNQRVDPVNYMKAKAPITQKQIDEAHKFVEEEGYMDSFDRRFAVIDDINVAEIIHTNSDVAPEKQASVFDKVKPSTSTRHKRSQFNDVEEVSIDKFMKDILPSCTSVEAFLENRFAGNLVTMTTANNKDSKRIFKWNNNYSWTYNGNLAGKSELRDAVSAKGGRVDGVFRFSHSWNEIEPNQSLMDLHVFMPGNEHKYRGKVHDEYGSGRRVGWNRRQDPASGGKQDVDYVNQAPVGYVPVENITFPTLSKMPEGKYICKIHNWSYRNSGGRGKAEIEFEGNTYQYEYPKTKNKEWVEVAEVTLKNGKFSIKHLLPETNSSKPMWGLESNNFQKVNLVCLSPNHWGDNNTGNKHYFFMLEKCYSDSPVRSFHNENLNADLLKHRKVMEVLGATNNLEPSKKQLAGLGFNATVKDELIVRLSGNFKRVVKIKF